MLIRLLQQFSSFELVQDANPESVPPPGWAKCKGSNGQDKVWIKAHLTMYIKVNPLVCLSYCSLAITRSSQSHLTFAIQIGWLVGENG